MTTAYTSLLGLALPVTGELSGTWGDVVNQSITSLLDTSVAGTTNVSTDANVTLTTTTGASNQARQAILLFSGARTAIRTVTAPAQSKIYTVINATTGGFAVTLVGAGPTTGVTIANGARTVVAWNGSDFVEVSSPSSIILPGGTANGVLYLNGSKVVTSGSALTFDGTTLGVNASFGTSTAALTLKNSTAASSSNIVEQQFFAANSFSGLDTIAKFGALNPSAGANNYGSFYWSLANAGSPSEQMRLTSTGLGIGTTSPTANRKLDAVLNVNATAGLKVTNSSGGAASSANTSYSNGTESHEFGILGTGFTTYGVLAAGDAYIYAGAGKNISLSADGGGVIKFGTGAGGTERARIDSSGNFGLGVTPSAWSVSGVLQTQNSGSYLFGGGTGWSGGNFMYLGNNGYYNGTNWIYSRTNAVSQYVQVNGEHRWQYAPSGTAGNAITFTQAMTLDASGNLLLGATDNNGSVRIQSRGIIASSTSQFTWSTFDGYTDGNLYITANAGAANTTNSNIIFRSSTSGGSVTERCRIESSGNLLVGRTNPTFYGGGAKLGVEQTSDGAWAMGINANGNAIVFNHTGNTSSAVGTISLSTSTTTYNTSSDYRLKNTIAPMTGALAKVAQLKPVTYKWNVDGSDGQGFIAHELAEVVPQCVTGQKDAVDAEGNPKYQGIDTSFLVATLTAALQEAVAEINSLKARLDAANL